MDVVLGLEVNFIENGISALEEDCIRSRGYAAPGEDLSVAAVSTITAADRFASMHVDDSQFGPVDEATARRSGFGTDSSAAPGSLLSFDPAYDALAEQCGAEVSERLGADAYATTNAYYQLANDINGAIIDSSSDDSDSWPGGRGAVLSCLDGRGYRPVVEVSDELGFDDFGVPFGALEPFPGSEWTPAAVPGTVERAPDEPARRYIPTEAEVDFAVAWVQCADELGLREQARAEANAVRLDAVEQHAAGLTELNPQIQDLARRVAALAGQAPPR